MLVAYLAFACTLLCMLSMGRAIAVGYVRVGGLSLTKSLSVVSSGLREGYHLYTAVLGIVPYTTDGTGHARPQRTPAEPPSHHEQPTVSSQRVRACRVALFVLSVPGSFKHATAYRWIHELRKGPTAADGVLVTTPLQGPTAPAVRLSRLR